MSRGIEAVYRMLAIENDKVIYGYSGNDFNYPYDKEIAGSYDGRIEIQLSAFNTVDEDDLLSNEKVRVVKECYYAEKNMYGFDILALLTVRNIITKYRETNEIPKEGHWIV